MKYLIILMFLVGCSSIQYNTQDASFSYFRVMNQQIKGLEVHKGIDGVEVKMDSQISKNDEVLIKLSENLDKALKILNEIQKKIPNLF